MTPDSIWYDDPSPMTPVGLGHRGWTGEGSFPGGGSCPRTPADRQERRGMYGNRLGDMRRESSSVPAGVVLINE